MARAYYPDSTGAMIAWTPEMVGAAAADHTHTNLSVNTLIKKGENTISGIANDTVSNWSAQGGSYHFYSVPDSIIGQPAQWGYLVNLGEDSEVHQVWFTQASGTVYHRGGNGRGWYGDSAWTAFVDSANPEVCVQSSTPTNTNAKIWVKV